MYWAACSSIGSLKTLCSRLAMTVTCSRRLAASSRCPAVSGGSSPDHESPGTATMYQSSHAVAAARASQNSILILHDKAWVVDRGSWVVPGLESRITKHDLRFRPLERGYLQFRRDLVEGGDERRGQRYTVLRAVRAGGVAAVARESDTIHAGQGLGVAQVAY